MFSLQFLSPQGFLPVSPELLVNMKPLTSPVLCLGPNDSNCCVQANLSTVGFHLSVAN